MRPRPDLAALAAPPVKAFVERYFLLYTPLWIAAVAIVLWTQAFTRWGDAGHMALGIGMALPVWLLPLIIERERPLLERYSFKAVTFITLFSFIQNYFGAPLFFRYFGMEYHFNVTIVGNGSPWFLSPMTVAYFCTYFAIMQASLRALRRPIARVQRARARAVLLVLACMLLGATMAFLETLTMANELLHGYFAYASKTRMLAIGSLCYGTLLAIALPLYARIDEAPQQPTPIGALLWQILGSNLLILICYELYGLLL